MFRRLFAWINRYERHLSALAMVAGFAWDNIFLGRVDEARTQWVFSIYAAICIVSITLLHAIETRGEKTGYRPRWRGIFPIATQFALGGFWSGFVIFYGRTAAISATWPYLLVILAIFIGNEALKRYHERLVFTGVLFFFALYSFAIFDLPIYTHHLGVLTFLGSGVIAVVIFAFFTSLLGKISGGRFAADIYYARAGAIGVLLLINLFYFAGVLPPLPLAAKAAGVYHNVSHDAGGYHGSVEASQTSFAAHYLDATPTLHITSGGSVYAYSAVFAPTALTTLIVHRWQWYDPTTGSWQTRFALPYPIEGGADGGYRGYSAIVPKVEGRWRVSIETADGRVIARIPFDIAFTSAEAPVTTLTLP